MPRWLSGPDFHRHLQDANLPTPRRWKCLKCGADLGLWSTPSDWDGKTLSELPRQPDGTFVHGCGGEVKKDG